MKEGVWGLEGHQGETVCVIACLFHAFVFDLCGGKSRCSRRWVEGGTGMEEIRETGHKGSMGSIV